MLCLALLIFSCHACRSYLSSSPKLGTQTPRIPAIALSKKSTGQVFLLFVWLQSKRKLPADLHVWLDASWEGQNTLLDAFPFETELCSHVDLKPETPFVY